MSSKKEEKNEDYFLVQAFIKGNQEAGRKLYDAIDSFLVSFLSKRLEAYKITKEEMEDLKLDVACKTLTDIHKYNGSCKFSTWILGYAKNFAYCKITEKIKEEKRIQNLMLSSFDHYENPLTLLIQKEEKEILIQKLNRLDQKLYTILWLRFYCFMTFHEIAEYLMLSYTTVYNNYQKGLTLLKEMLTHCPYEFEF